MTDREKAIKGIDICLQRFHCGEDCPYYNNAKSGCIEQLRDDVLSLLKEQELGHWIFLTDCSNSGVYCSECNTKVFDSYPFKKKCSYFCPHCGTRMEGAIERR